MADSSCWWTTISTGELLDLRRRLLEHVKVQFGNTLKAELEDIVQHAFAVLFRRREGVKAESDGLYRYLKTVSQHAALDRIRTAKRRQGHLVGRSNAEGVDRGSGLPSPGISPEESREQNEKIWSVFCALDDLDRLVIWSYVVDGKSIRAISGDLGLNWHRVAGIISKAMRLLRSRFAS